MKKLLLGLLLISSISNAQLMGVSSHSVLPKKKALTESAFNSISVSFKNDQRVNLPIHVTASTGTKITYWKWEVFESSTRTLYDVSFDQNPTFYITDSLKFYDLKLTAKNGVDYIEQRFDRAWFLSQKRFTEAEADIVIDGSTYYNDFASADNSDLKILIKAGTWSGYIEPANLQGTAGHPVRIQVDGDVNITCNGGIAHTMWINGDSRFIIVDGFKSDGTNGLHLTGLTDGSGQVLITKGGKFTDITVLGVDVTHNIGAFAAGISFIPDVTSASNATNWPMNNIFIYRCKGTNTGDEFIYLNYNNDTPQGTPAVNQPPKCINCVIARNSCNGTGRDSYQPGSCVNLRMHDNVGMNWGLDQSKDQESFISFNGGNSNCIVYNNIGLNGKMMLNIQSGKNPWNTYAGESSPGENWFIGNYIDNGTYPAGGYAEPFSIYAQTYSGSGSGSYKIHIAHCTLISDKKLMEFYCQPTSFNISGMTLSNNIIRRVGASAGDYNEFNIVENGYTLTDISVNNIVRTTSVADVYFTNLAANDVTISSFSSVAYGSTTDLTTRLSAISDYFYDLAGYPLIAPGQNPTFGAYSGYQKRTVTPPTGDTSPATFSTPVTMTSLTQSGGTLGYESNKLGRLFYVVSATDNAPTKAQIKAGKNYLGTAAPVSGSLKDVGTVTPKVITGGNESTNYYQFSYFLTTNWIEQSSPTRVAFTTISDATAPTLSGFNITDGQRSRVYFNSSEPITGTTFSNFTISGKTISGITIASGTTTGHYFTVSVAFNASDLPTIAYSGGNNFKDVSVAQNSLASFGATSISNAIVPIGSEDWIAGQSSNASITAGKATATGAGGIRTSKYIPSNSNGWVQWGYESTAQANDSRIGLILNGTTFTYSASQLLSGSLFLTNTNTDVYQGSTYKYTKGGAESSGNLFRFRVERVANHVYFEYSINGGSTWTNLYDMGAIGAGDLRGAIVFGTSGKTFPNLKIQADNGLQ